MDASEVSRFLGCDCFNQDFEIPGKAYEGDAGRLSPLRTIHSQSKCEVQTYKSRRPMRLDPALGINLIYLSRSPSSVGKRTA
jgi:hypothetical protein